MAVYTKISPAEIAEHLKKYDLGEVVSLKEILDGIDNSNFILETQKGKFILTIFESRINKKDLPFFINLKLHLAQNGICCPCPILDKSGVAITDFNGKESVIVTFLSGATLKSDADGYYRNIVPNHCFEVGKELAMLHLAAADFKMSRPNDLGIDGWKPLFLKFEGFMENYQKNLRDEILENINFLETSWRRDLPTNSCHLDLFPDNVFFADNAKLSGVIDFYFAAEDALVYDFAVIVNAWCFDEKNYFVQKRFDEMLCGYESLRKFSNDEKDFLKIACAGAAMRFLLTRLHDMFFTPKDSLVRIKNPQEYLEKLRFFRTAL